MFLLPIFALAAGFLLFWMPLKGFAVNEAMAPYMAIALLAGFDTVLGGWRAWLVDQFDDLVFVSGFFVNALLAAGLVFIGERLGLEAGFGDAQISIMMIGAVVVFSTRIFNNLAVLRRLLIDRLRARRAPQKPATDADITISDVSDAASSRQAI